MRQGTANWYWQGLRAAPALVDLRSAPQGYHFGIYGRAAKGPNASALAVCKIAQVNGLIQHFVLNPRVPRAKQSPATFIFELRHVPES